MSLEQVHSCIIGSETATTDTFTWDDSYVSGLKNNTIKVSNQIVIPTRSKKEDEKQAQQNLLVWASKSLPPTLYQNVLNRSNSGYSLQQLYNYIHSDLGYMIPENLLVKHNFTYEVTDILSGRKRQETLPNQPAIVLIKSPVPPVVTTELNTYSFIDKLPNGGEPLWKQYYRIYYPDPTKTSRNTQDVWLFKDGKATKYFKNFNDYLQAVLGKLQLSPQQNENKIRAIQTFLSTGVMIP